MNLSSAWKNFQLDEKKFPPRQTGVNCSLEEEKIYNSPSSLAKNSRKFWAVWISKSLS